MDWIFFILLASFLWAIVNIVDKFLVSNWVKNPRIPILVLGCMGLLWALGIYLIKGYSGITGINILWAFAAGSIYIIANIFYFKALQAGEVSRVVPIFHLVPLFVLIMAYFFLDEIFSMYKYLGIIMLIIGSIFISSTDLKHIRPGKALLPAVVSSLFFAITFIINKYLLSTSDFWTVFSYIRIGAVFILVPLFIIDYKDLKTTIKERGVKVIVLISANEVIDMFAVLFYTIAASVGYVTLVHALGSVQSFIVFGLSIILSIFLPRIIKENLDRKVMIQKFAAIIMLFAGALMLV